MFAKRSPNFFLEIWWKLPFYVGSRLHLDGSETGARSLLGSTYLSFSLGSAFTLEAPCKLSVKPNLIRSGKEVVNLE